MLALKLLFWLSLGGLLWTHLLYPLGAAALARVRTRARSARAIEPTVTVIVVAYNEEAVIEGPAREPARARLPGRPARARRHLRRVDRPHPRAVERFGDRVRLIVNPRGGKVAAQNGAVRETSGEIVAFSDANATWAPDALRRLVENFADPEVAYVCGRLVLEAADGSNREGLYWRYELQQRRRNRGWARSPAGTARSTRSGAATTSRSTRSGATTSLFRTGWFRTAGGRSTSRMRVRLRNRRRRTKRSTAARCACSSTAGRPRCAARC